MTDTTSWTEPLESERERGYLGIESDRGLGERRGAACMREAGRLPMRERRCAHYGRGVKRGQRDAIGRARLPRNGLDDQFDRLKAPASFGIVEIAHAHQTLTESLDEFPGPFVSRTQGETRFHSRVTGQRARR